MRRRLFTFTFALSLLLLFAALSVLWVRSYWASAGVVRSDTGGGYGVYVSRGQLLAHRIRDVDPGRVPAVRVAFDGGLLHSWHEQAELDRPARRYHALGFGFMSGGGSFDWCVNVPLWSLVLLTLSLSARLTWVTCRRRSRRRAGQCPACGYDLRATPGRCPECGAAPA